MQALWSDVATIVATAIGAYLWLILVLRVSGKRSLAKLNAFDFAITVAFGSALAAVILNSDVGLVRGATALAMLALLQYALSKLSMHSKWLRRLVRSTPTLLLEDGRKLREAMHHERVTEDELAEAVRKQGFGSLDQVGAVVLETDGSFSVLEKSDCGIDLLESVNRIGKKEDE